MSPRERQPAAPGARIGRAVILSAILSVTAILVAVGALAVVLTRGTDTSREDPNACRSVAWDAVPSVVTLPPSWSIASTRLFVDNQSTTLVGPAPSGSTQVTAAFISVSCYGTDARLALARNHEAALAAGATDLTIPSLGDESLAVTSTRTSNTTVYVRRGILVADITVPASLGQTTVLAMAGAVDDAMARAVSSSPRPSSTAGSPGASIGASPAASPSGALGPSPSPSPPSPAPLSHVARDLEALLPHAVSGTTLTSQSISGTTALRTDVTSTSLIASLKKLGKTPADLVIAEAHDATGALPLRLLAFRAKGVKVPDLASAIVASWMANTTGTPTRSTVTIGGHPLTRVAYASGAADYVYEGTGVVFDIETTDETLVSAVLPLLK